MGLDEAEQAEPVRRSENDTHDIEGTETVHAPVPKRSVDPRCIPKPFVPDTACETSVHDVQAPEPFQGSMTTTTPGSSMPISSMPTSRVLFTSFVGTSFLC